MKRVTSAMMMMMVSALGLTGCESLSNPGAFDRLLTLSSVSGKLGSGVPRYYDEHPRTPVEGDPPARSLPAGPNTELGAFGSVANPSSDGYHGDVSSSEHP
ncbi:MAG: hypothetical protein IT440_01740 [Phycisphaeraceae bacterium]|nr:hypothetical protein [Phycisphaeraceae bacterium]